MGWPQKLVFLNGLLLREGTDYIWIRDRLLFKRQPATQDDAVTVVYCDGHRADYGLHDKNVLEILDPLSKR